MRTLKIKLTDKRFYIYDKEHAFTDEELKQIKKEIKEARDNDLENGLLKIGYDDDIDDFMDNFDENSELENLLKRYVKSIDRIADEVLLKVRFVGLGYYILIRFNCEICDWIFNKGELIWVE